MLRVSSLILLAILAGCAGPEFETAVEAPAFAAAKRLPLDICEIDGVDEPLLCGKFSAPQDWSAPDGPKFEIAVLVIPAANGNPDNLAWTEHQGGPGRTGLSAVRFFFDVETGRSLRKNRDVVLFDQRGVGQSGGLYCDALRTPVLEAYFTADKVAACREEMLAQGVRFERYSTLASIDDLEGIRKWLGYDQFDVGGWSYGSRFMLTYAQRYPDSLRTMMVAVPTLFDYRRPLDWARFTEEAMVGLFADCTAEPACNKAFPNLEADYESLLEALDAAPVSVELFNPVTARQAVAEVTRARVIDEVHAALLRVSSTRLLPLAIHEAANGNLEPFMALAVPETAPRPIAEAQYLSIVCSEETAFFTRDEAEATAAGTFTGMHFADEFKDACREWGLGPHGDYPLPWNASDVPTLVISGDRDPITPDEYGQRIAATLSNVKHLKIHRMPHDFSGLEGAVCLDRILLEFLATKSPNELDIDCIAEMSAPPFLLTIPE